MKLATEEADFDKRIARYPRLAESAPVTKEVRTETVYELLERLAREYAKSTFDQSFSLTSVT